MISTLSGPILDISSNSALIDCHGVGYEAFCPVRTLATLTVGQTTRLFTVLNVREDALTLFGFSTPTEKAFFVQLTNVSGVGPKLGLSLLSTFTPDEIRQAISANQPATLARASGVGKKMAEKIIVELKDKMGSLPLIASATGLPPSTLADVASALMNLGYAAKQAEAAATEALNTNPAAPFATVFRLALQKVAA